MKTRAQRVDIQSLGYQLTCLNAHIAEKDVVSKEKSHFHSTSFMSNLISYDLDLTGRMRSLIMEDEFLQHIHSCRNFMS